MVLYKAAQSRTLSLSKSVGFDKLSQRQDTAFSLSMYFLELGGKG